MKKVSFFALFLCFFFLIFTNNVFADIPKIIVQNTTGIDKEYNHNNVVYSKDNKYLISINSDSISTWDLKSGLKIKTFKDKDNQNYNIDRYSYTSKYIATIGDYVHKQNYFIRVWDIESGTVFRVISMPEYDASKVFVSPNNKYVSAFGGYNSNTNKITVFDIKSGKIAKIFKFKGDSNSNSNRSIFYDSTGNFINIRSNNDLEIFDIKTGKIIKKLNNIFNKNDVDEFDTYGSYESNNDFITIFDNKNRNHLGT